MTALSIQPTFPTFTGADGQPLENGYIWIGTANLNPITNPITVYWDAALSAPATQPIRTLGGYPSNSGTPSRLYVSSNYSIQVLDRKGSMVYSSPVATERYGGGIINANIVVYDPAGTGAVATTVQSKLRESVSVSNYTTFQQAVDTGKDVFIPAGVSVNADGVLLTTAGQTIFGAGASSIAISTDPTQHAFTVRADNVTFKDFRLNGSATSNTNSTFGIFTATANPANALSIIRVLFSGVSAGVGLNNGIKFDDNCNRGLVFGCEFQRLWGNTTGRGYGVLLGAVAGTSVAYNQWYGSSGRGRHGIYLSAGATKNNVTGNYIYLADYEGITLNSTGVQPANANNTIAMNTIYGACAAIPGVTTGAISIFGHAAKNKIIGNTIQESYGCGMKLDGTGFTDLGDTDIKSNTITDSAYIGIDLVAAVAGSLVGNTISESSIASAGTHSNVRMVSDGTTATSKWLVGGNKSSGITYSRSAFQINSTAPAPSSITVKGNRFDVCNLTDVELNGVVIPIDGKLTGTVALTPPSIADGGSHSQGGLSFPGAEVGDSLSWSYRGYATNCDGCVMTVAITAANTAQYVIANLSGGTKTPTAATLDYVIHKATP